MSHFTSQHGEDRELAARFGHKRNGYFVEVGALDGVTFSNTHYFEHQLNWTGVLIEANPAQAEKCRIARPNSVVVSTAVVDPETAGKVLLFNVVEGFELLSTLRMTPWARMIYDTVSGSTDSKVSVRQIEVATATLDEVLDDADAPREFDLLSIDIEGHEWPALRGLSLGRRWRPRVLIIENGSGFASPKIVTYLFRAGYGYRRTIGPNDWYEPSPLGQRLAGLLPLYATHCNHGIRVVIKSLLFRLGLLAPVVRVVRTLRRNPRPRSRQGKL